DLHAAEAHRAARILVDQITDGETVALRDVEEAGVRRIGRRRPVRGATAHDRSADRRDLLRIQLRTSLFVEAGREVRGRAVLAARDVLRGHTIERRETAVSSDGRDGL